MHTTREIAKKGNIFLPTALKNQFSFFSFCYVLYCIALLALIKLRIIPETTIYWCLLLGISEHIAQEFQRLLIATYKPIAANFILFLRGGSWIIFLIPVLYFEPSTRNVEFILSSWLFGSVAGILTGALILRKPLLSATSQKADLKWIVNGIKICAPILAGTLAFRFVFIGDKYFANFLNTPTEVGIYVFYFSITSATLALVEAGVTSVKLPHLLKTYNEGSQIEYQAIRKDFIKRNLIATIIATMIVLIAAFATPTIIQREELNQNIATLLTLQLSFSLICLSLPFHYDLYASERDKCLIKINIISAAIFIMTTLISHYFTPENCVPVGVACFSLSIFLLKFRKSRHEYQNSVSV
ncbi:hypothetical protein [Pseudomonas citronellolis]|uniref:hypothetical protein n=1 Tax=Pseudomonas citronellolis TaxID=53408 RepID=UPI00248ECA0F|nr:hypothetical protein [Pseudomonas citronellolis]